MLVVSGPFGKEWVNYEAPVAARLRGETKKLLDWFEKENSTDLVLKAGVAHLWFVIIHAFDDGNGRIARAIADMVCAGSEHSPQRFCSLPAEIQQERKAYHLSTSMNADRHAMASDNPARFHFSSICRSAPSKPIFPPSTEWELQPEPLQHRTMRCGILR